MSFAEEFIQGHLAGQRERQSKEQQAMLLEERKWERDIKKKELERQALQDKLAERVMRRNEAIQGAQMQEGTAGTVAPGTKMQIPSVGANPGNQAFGLPGGPAPTPPSGIIPPEAYQTHAPVTIPGVFGPDTTVTPKTGYQKIQEDIATRTREAEMKRAEEKPFAIPEKSRGIYDPATRSYTPFPEGPASNEPAKNAVELYQKDPAAWEKMISTQARIDHVLNPQKETDAKFQYNLFKSDPKTWEKLFGTSKSRDPGAELLAITNLAKNPATGDIDPVLAGQIQTWVENARSGKPIGFTVPAALAPPTGGGGMLNSILPGGPTPPAPGPPPSVMPPPAAAPVSQNAVKAKPTPAELQKQGYVKVKGGWRKAK